MGDLAQIRKRFTVWLATMGVLSAALFAYLLWPGSRGPQPDVLRAEYATLKRDVELRRRSNPQATRAALKKLYADDVATRDSQISQQLEKLLRDNGITAQVKKYEMEKSNESKNSLPGIQRVKIDTTITGDYTKIAKFINAMEQAKLLFIVNKISLSSHEGGQVTLQMSFDTFLKETA